MDIADILHAKGHFCPSLLKKNQKKQNKTKQNKKQTNKQNKTQNKTKTNKLTNLYSQKITEKNPKTLYNEVPVLIPEWQISVEVDTMAQI